MPGGLHSGTFVQCCPLLGAAVDKEPGAGVDQQSNEDAEERAVRRERVAGQARKEAERQPGSSRE